MSIIRVFPFYISLIFYLNFFSPSIHSLSMTYKEHSNNSNTFIVELSKRHGEVKYQLYSKGRILGEGGFAICYKAVRNSDSKVFAMKLIKLNDKKDLSNSRDKHKTSKHHHKVSTEEKAHT